MTLSSISYPSILLQIKEAGIGGGNPLAEGLQPQHFNDLSLNPLICVPLPVIEVSWVGEVCLREDWDIYAACQLFILKVTWFKLCELSLLSAGSWLQCVVLLQDACVEYVCGCVCARKRVKQPTVQMVVP